LEVKKLSLTQQKHETHAYKMISDITQKHNNKPKQTHKNEIM